MSYCRTCQAHYYSDKCPFHGELPAPPVGPVGQCGFPTSPESHCAPGYNVKVDNLFQYDNQTNSPPTYEDLVDKNIEYATKLVMKGVDISHLTDDLLREQQYTKKLKKELEDLYDSRHQIIKIWKKEVSELQDKLNLSELLLKTAIEEKDNALEALANSREAGMKKAMGLVDEIKENERLESVNHALSTNVLVLENQLKDLCLTRDCLAQTLDTARDTIRINREHHETDAGSLHEEVEKLKRVNSTLSTKVDTLEKNEIYLLHTSQNNIDQMNACRLELDRANRETKCLQHNLGNAYAAIKNIRDESKTELRSLQDILDSRIADIKSLRQTIASLTDKANK